MRLETSPALHTAKPWYKEPWPWFLMAGPALVVVGGFITLFLANKSFDGLVEDDYYKQGLAIHQRLEREQKADSLGFSAQIMAGEGNEVRVFLSSSLPEGGAMPERIRVDFNHPTRDGMDRSVDLLRQGEGFYTGILPDALPVSDHWNVVLSDAEETWRLMGGWRPDSGGALSKMRSVADHAPE